VAGAFSFRKFLKKAKSMTDQISNSQAVNSAVEVQDVADAKGEISAKQAAAVLQFLQRAQMQGAEMPVYVDVFNTLSGIVAAAQAGAAPQQ